MSLSVKGGIPVKDKTSMLVDGDQIAIAVDDLAPDPKDPKYIRAQIRLELAPGVTWWKSLQIVSRSEDGKGNTTYHPYGQCELQDDKKGPALALDYHILAGAKPPPFFEVRFWKAKFLGVHTEMERWVIKTPDLLGHRMTFTWLID